MPSRTRKPTATATLAVAVGVLSLLPVSYLFIAGFSFADIRQLFSFPTTVPDIARTIGLTVSVSVLSIVLGVAAATLVVRTDIPGRKLLTVLFAMPLAVPGFVSAYAAYSANLMFFPQADLVTNFAGATAVLSLSLYPYVFLPAVIALRNTDPAQEEVARSLGTRSHAVFGRIVVPQLRPALAGGVLIVALHVLSEYGAMVQLRQRTLTTTIMAEMIDYGDYSSARSISVLLAVFSFGVLLANRAFSGRTVPGSVGSGSVRPPSRWRLRGAKPLVMATALLIPGLALGPTALMTVRGLTSPHRSAVVHWPDVFAAMGSTLGYAGWAALFATILAFPVSWWVSRKPSVSSHLTERSIWVAHSVPNAILALALVFLATRLLPGMYKTAALLVLAYVILYLPLAVSNQRVGMQAALVKYDDVAASLGSGSFRRFFRVSLPLALPGVVTGALLVGLDASKELTTTLMLLPYNSNTLATGLWSTTNGESLDFTAAAPYTLMLVILGSIPVFLIVRRTLRYVR
ncbi:ABC transporter permease [Arthrobacter rhombi]|uniref:ABC transporter permease n=1 Tax=Arthrobacter rhombi TaxID=71253 RepID=UPI003FD50CD9